jgi:predicted KAP-like P-loop ATPase
MTTPVPFATDQPIASSEEDRFSRKQFAYRVAHTIAHRSDPSSIVVGVYGAWGEGKTSVLRMIDEALATEQDVKTFWFNPWRYRDEETLLEQFFRSMARTLGSSISSKSEDLGGLLRKYKHVVAPLLMIGGAVTKSCCARLL